LLRRCCGVAAALLRRCCGVAAALLQQQQSLVEGLDAAVTVLTLASVLSQSWQLAMAEEGQGKSAQMHRAEGSC